MAMSLYRAGVKGPWKDSQAPAGEASDMARLVVREEDRMQNAVPVQVRVPLRVMRKADGMQNSIQVELRLRGLVVRGQDGLRTLFESRYDCGLMNSG
jgi:hypothetical protein